MLRVLHLRSSAGFWGPERQITQLLRPMRQHGFELEVLLLYRREARSPRVHPLVAAVRRKGGLATQLNARWRDLPHLVRAIAGRLEAGRYAVLHTHEYKGNILGGLAAALSDVPAVASVRGYTDRTLPLRLYKYVDFQALRWFDSVLPVSDHVRGQLLRAGLPSRRLATVHDAIDSESFRSGLKSSLHEFRKGLGLDRDTMVVSIVGRLSVEKGHRWFLESAERMLKSLPEVHFLVVGDGPQRARLESYAVNLGIDGSVSFLGHRHDIPTIMASSNVLVHASLREGFGNVLLEAMTIGKPVVATAVGGVPEVVTHEMTGLLVPPRAPDAMARAVLSLLRDPDEAQRMGAYGREVASQKFHIDMLARKLAQVYHGLLGINETFES